MVRKFFLMFKKLCFYVLVFLFSVNCLKAGKFQAPKKVKKIPLHTFIKKKGYKELAKGVSSLDNLIHLSLQFKSNHYKEFYSKNDSEFEVNSFDAEYGIFYLCKQGWF